MFFSYSSVWHNIQSPWDSIIRSIRRFCNTNEKESLFFKQKKVSCRELLCQVASRFFFFCLFRVISNKGAADAVNSPGASYATLYSSSGGKDVGRRGKFTPGECRGTGEKTDRHTCVQTHSHTHWHKLRHKSYFGKHYLQRNRVMVMVTIWKFYTWLPLIADRGQRLNQQLNLFSIKM